MQTLRQVVEAEAWLKHKYERRLEYKALKFKVFKMEVIFNESEWYRITMSGLGAIERLEKRLKPRDSSKSLISSGT